MSIDGSANGNTYLQPEFDSDILRQRREESQAEEEAEFPASRRPEVSEKHRHFADTIAYTTLMNQSVGMKRWLLMPSIYWKLLGVNQQPGHWT